MRLVAPPGRYPVLSPSDMSVCLLGPTDEAGVLPAGPDETRAVERGSRIVAVIPAAISVVLQVCFVRRQREQY